MNDAPEKSLEFPTTASGWLEILSRLGDTQTILIELPTALIIAALLAVWLWPRPPSGKL